MGFFSSIFGHSEPSEENKFETLRDDGVRAMQIGELAYAEKCLKAALEIRGDLKTEGFLAEVYLRRQDYENALPLLEKLKNEGGDTLEITLLLAQSQGSTKLFADERKTVAAVLERTPGEPRALYLAAEADHGLGDDTQAVGHLTECLALRPDYTTAQMLRARVLFGMRRFEDTLLDVDALLEKDPANEECLLLRGKAYAALGHTDDATADFEKVCSLNPFNRESVLLLGAAYEQAGRFDKAVALYSESIDIAPDFADAYKARGRVRYWLNDERGAEDDMRRTLELTHDSEKGESGDYTTAENKMNDYYRKMNPFGI